MAKATRSNKERLLQAIPSLRRPLVVLARRNFESIDQIGGLSKRLLQDVVPLCNLELPKTFQEKISKLSNLLEDFETLSAGEKRRRLLDVLAVLDRLEELAHRKVAPPDTSTHGGKLQLDRRPLFNSVQFLKGVGPRLAEHFAARSIATVEDLLYFLPTRWVDLRQVSRISALEVGEFGQAVGTIMTMSANWKPYLKKPFELVVQDATGTVTCSWFHYGGNAIPNRFKVGDKVRIAGKINAFRGRHQIVHPEIELASDTPMREGHLIRPVYPEIKGIAARQLSEIVQQALVDYLQLLEDPFPAELRKRANLPDLLETLRYLHHPGDQVDAAKLNLGESPYQRRLVFDEFFFVQLALMQKRGAVKSSQGVAHRRLNTLAKAFYKRFPHQLTDAQRRVISEIVEDLVSPSPMNRLLQGDVGSGKTVVAVLTALLIVENGYQVALMAPTEILAEQHYRSISELCAPLDLRVELLTSDIRRSDKLAIYEDIQSGEIDFVIGTHALIQKGVEFKKLGYVIVDEQHRFGVDQRANLRSKGMLPDCLVMTATPIPRSLSLTVYGDLDVSILDELPKGRRPIITEVLWMSEQSVVERKLKKEVQAGRQVYVITPLVSESEKMDLKDAESEWERLRAVFPEFTVGLLHGRMSRIDKDSVMRAFLEGVYDILVSTTVVEVGVDVPNATVMVVQHAERFGLAQLHQLRGRVGRGKSESYCYLMCEHVSDDARERLAIMEQTTDGFRIAEKDLEIRGPGDFLGTRQTGTPLFVHANLIRHQHILQEAREVAQWLIEQDPELRQPEHEKIRQQFESRWLERLNLIGIG